jgi:pyruvate, orthophosphate dikinase
LGGAENVIKSSALEANLATYSVDVSMDPRYTVIQDIMSKYYGIMEGVNTFLEELSHPHRNWPFIVKEARGYALNYFHLIKAHPDGPEGAQRFSEIFTLVVSEAPQVETRADAADNLLFFLQKMLKESGDRLADFFPVFDATFRALCTLNDTEFFLFVKSYYGLDRLGPLFLKSVSKDAPASVESPDVPYRSLRDLLIRYYRRAYDHWLAEADPLDWLKTEVGDSLEAETVEPVFGPISHRRIGVHRGTLDDIAARKPTGPADARRQLEAILELPGFNHFVGRYREIPRNLLEAGKASGKGNGWKVIFLFHIMNIPGLSSIHEDALRDINRTLEWLIGNEKHLNIEKLILKTFSILSARMAEFPLTVLNCIFNMGKGVYQTDDSDLINFFIDQVIDLGFHSPRIQGVGNDWQIRVNNAHIQNIRTWLNLIEISPRRSTRLLSSLIIHLTLCGVFVKDTDLFPRDITDLLNSPIKPVYNLAKQLAKLFPVYFNDIGAEGALRDTSTQIDEITHRKDPLIHFLRKQTHVESSNRIIGFIEATIQFWATRDKSLVEPYVPPSIHETIEAEGPFVDGVHRIMSRLSKMGLSLPWDLLDAPESWLKGRLAKIEAETGDIPEDDFKRTALAVSLYKMLHQKYDLNLFKSESDLEAYLSGLHSEAFPDFGKLKAALGQGEIKSKLFGLLDYLEELKKVILSDETFEIREDIYKKRHFTVDIPSMYGSYHETKFDALGLTFRIESYVNVLLEELIDNIDLSLITKATFYNIYDKLILFDKALRVDGIASMEFDGRLDLLVHSLEVRGFTFTQYMDIFKGFSRTVRNIINDYFHNIHEENLNRILAALPLDGVLDRYLPKEIDPEQESNRPDLIHGVSETFFREKIASCLGLQQLDRFLGRILNTLFQQSYKLPADRLRLLLNYDPKRAMMSIVEPSSKAAGMIYLGNKGFNLVKLCNFGFPVPPGFIITTEVFRCRAVIEEYGPANDNFREQVMHHIEVVERHTNPGASFGDPKNPLLFSVRSGSSISQPGMMDTFLDVGMNEEIAEGLAEKTGNQWFAWDCYRRFLQCWGMGHGLKRDDFDSVIKTFKELWNIPLKRGFPGEMMRSVALAYKRMIEEADIEVVEDPFEQLLATIRMVLNSWDTAKAKTYRRIMGISNDWGTAVTVQAMVFGNKAEDSGTGVFFTHNPRWQGDDSIRLWGDFTVENQGEDVVSGLVTTAPISISQQNIEMRDTDVILETHFPEIYKTLKSWAEDLIYKKGWSPQEMEFTFESRSPNDLYLLQTRDMGIRERKKKVAYRPVDISDEKLLGYGVGVSGGLMSGRVVFTLEDIDEWRREEPETPLILLRADTVPDDIRELNAADGILTARGGLTSHAAVVAHRLEKTCVVGCGNLVCKEKEKTGQFDGVTIHSGDFISIDGQEGTVYEGKIETQRTVTA